MEIRFNKGLGQNFIFDKNLLGAIAADAQIDKDDTVLEIGAGAGTLTQELAKRAKRVVSYEIDRNLKEILDKNLEMYPNVQLIFEDFMKADLKTLADLGKIRISANLPYYITTPILFRLIESELQIKSITVLVQKEVAQRICAQPNTKDYGALTLTIGSQFNASIKRIVKRNMFKPVPNVDSAVVHLEHARPYDKNLNKTIRSLFAFRRKTVVNNLMAGYSLSRENAQKIIENANLSTLIRAEQLTLEDIKKINSLLIEI